MFDHAFNEHVVLLVSQDLCVDEERSRVHLKCEAEGLLVEFQREVLDAELDESLLYSVLEVVVVRAAACELVELEKVLVGHATESLGVALAVCNQLEKASKPRLRLSHCLRKQLAHVIHSFECQMHLGYRYG